MGIAYAGIGLSLHQLDSAALRLAVNTALIGLYGAAAWLFMRRRPATEHTLY